MTRRSALPTLEDKPVFVRQMFDRIAERYDLVNRIMTFGLDQRWRRQLVDALALAPGDVAVDLACGTGDLMEMLTARGARVIGVDFSGEMLQANARRQPQALLVQADGAALPLSDASTSAITCGFALRNFANLEAVLAECARVLVPGGHLALIEVDEPRSAVVRALHAIHFRKLVPIVGGMLSDRDAYRYLPESTRFLPNESDLRALLAKTGFADVRKTVHLFGAAQSLHARKATP